MEKIAILNNECFRDTDMTLMRMLYEKFEIDYYYIKDKNSYVSISFMNQIVGEIPNSKFILVNGKWRRRNLHYAIELFKVIKHISQNKYKCILTGIREDLFTSLLLLLYFKKDDLVYMIHDAKPHVFHGLNLNRRLISSVDKLFITHWRKFLLFSQTQYQYFYKTFDFKGNCSYIKLPGSYWGKPSVEEPCIDNGCVFLFLGNIFYYKGLDFLIEASEELFKMTDRKFEICIIGKVHDDGWRKLIKTPSLYKVENRKFDDYEIPNILSSCHFIVLPYREVTQSGPMALAFEYNVPQIASDIGVFSNYIKDNHTGFLFKCGDSHDLALKMKKAIELNTVDYGKMKENNNIYYKQMFDIDSNRKTMLDLINISNKKNKNNGNN